MSWEVLPLDAVNSLIEPGPVTLLTTTDGREKDVMTLSCHVMMEFEPTLIGCVISSFSHSYDLLLASGECAINIPSVDLRETVLGCGHSTGQDIDKFERYELSTRSGKLVSAPLINECFANLECELVDRSRVQQYCFFVLQVVRGWIDPQRQNSCTLHHRGQGQFMIAGDEGRHPWPTL